MLIECLTSMTSVGRIVCGVLRWVCAGHNLARVSGEYVLAREHRSVGHTTSPCSHFGSCTQLEFLWCPVWCGVAVNGVRTPSKSLVDTGEQPVFAFDLDNQVERELTGVFVYTNLKRTSYWQLLRTDRSSMLAAVGAKHHAIVDF